MQRGSDRHGPRLDDDLKQEFESDERANRATRAHEWRDPEPSEAELAVPGSERTPEREEVAQTVGEVMTAGVVGVAPTTPVAEAAAQMRDFDVGDVLVLADGELQGILTDRDIVVRVVAAGLDASAVPVGDVCSSRLATVTGATPVAEAVQTMRQQALRRLPVLDDRGRVAGVASIGDFALANDPSSALADVSAAPPNE